MPLPIIAANPVDAPDLYDVLYLAGVPSPGIFKFVEPPERKTGWDVQTPPGSAGGMPFRRNEPLIEINCTLYLWKGDDEEGGQVDHFAGWERFRKVLDMRPKKPVTVSERRQVGTDASGNPVYVNSSTTSKVFQGLDVSHPQLDQLKPPVRAVVVKSYTEPAPDGQGGATVKITFLEVRPVTRRAVVSALGGKSTHDRNGDPQDIIDLRAAVAQANEDWKNP